jgi:hypothetical protein
MAILKLKKGATMKKLGGFVMMGILGLALAGWVQAADQDIKQTPACK